MRKTVCLVCLSVLCLLLLCACTKANDYSLSFAADGGDKLEYIHVFGDEQIVYTVGGTVTVGEDDQAKPLELALADGDVTMEEILASVREDGDDGDVEAVTYPDGSVEYRFSTFTLVCLNTHTGVHDVYFVPTGMGYYDVVH